MTTPVEVQLSRERFDKTKKFMWACAVTGNIGDWNPAYELVTALLATLEKNGAVTITLGPEEESDESA